MSRGAVGRERAGRERPGYRGRTVVTTGLGYDCHRFAAGRRLVLGGVELCARSRPRRAIPTRTCSPTRSSTRCSGRPRWATSASTFPDTDEHYRDASSLDLLRTTVAMLHHRGISILHVDATVVIERPHVAPAREEIRRTLAEAIGISPEHVSVKATRGEGMGFVGARGGCGGAGDCNGGAVNRIHNVICSSGWWAVVVERELVPFGIDGDRARRRRARDRPRLRRHHARARAAVGPRLSVVELDPRYCERLRAKFGNGAVDGDPGRRHSRFRTPTGGSRRSCASRCSTTSRRWRSRTRRSPRSRACCVPAERSPAPTASAPAGCSSAIHVGDTLNLVDPDELPPRLEARRPRGARGPARRHARSAGRRRRP